MPPAWNGKVVVVTGGASGLGLATARVLAHRGASMALLDVDADGVERAAASLGGDALGLRVDISDAAALDAALTRVASQFGHIDTVIAGAAISGWSPVLDMDPALWERVIEVNLLGTWRTARAALPHLLRSRGYLLIISSGLAAVTGPTVSAYTASKAAVESLGRSLRVELAHRGVGVGVAYYAFLETPLVTAFDDNPGAVLARSFMPGSLGKTYPLAAAVQATVAGLDRRAARIVYPRGLRVPLVLRGLIGPRLERDLEKAMPEIERLARQARAAGPTGAVGPAPAA